jgi:hypothetical protein
MAQWQPMTSGQGDADADLSTTETGYEEPLEPGVEFPVELTEDQRQAFADWLSERVDTIVGQATSLSDADRDLVRSYLSATELEDIVEEWLDAYGDPENLAELAEQLRAEEGAEGTA